MKLRKLLLAGILVALVMVVGLPAIANAAPGASGSVTAATQYKVYVVKKGDTLGVISRKFGVPIATIVKVNKLGEASRIYVGQKLRIPVTDKKTADQKKSQKPTSNFKGPNAAKWIEVDLSQQRLYAHEYDQVVFTTRISSGIAGHRTPIGRFRIWAKVRRQTMSGPGYNLPNVQWVMYFAGENAIHGTYWHHNFGRPMSHGCINATNSAAKWLYNWAPSRTIVVVHR
jgi:lipoprotein-anchoring transpeptidase ErfK/SrfK